MAHEIGPVPTLRPNAGRNASNCQRSELLSKLVRYEFILASGVKRFASVRVS
jgi:hypothetical protein